MTPLVLLPGMMCDARLFGPQIAALEGRGIHVPSIGGHDSMKALAAEVLAAAPERFALAGLSMGGIVAMEVLRQASERVERLALLDTNPRAETPQVQARRAPQIEAARAGRLRAVMRDEMKPNYLADGPGRQEVLDLCMDMAMDLGPEVFVRQSVALRDRPDQQDTLRAVTVPTLILCGEKDALCPVERHTLMHGLIPGSTLTVIEGAGHLPTLERPDETNAALRRWLEAA
ncbi:alpha/beta fold hydrolase [Wenxinia marina]|uniref:Putative hydrolase or acyltransferase (Alpha/beta hydrolase superfamily) n=1 Tax=Wenxinia marina DSM 24838 TaxID=1123501 RepID=A0A0D0QBZ3_9RHOB|nr:alpha/beta fold hydrolase [Wenxinia marina]KIQ69807.1 putative hydrolase or acyltransferase (alpha/beta hydrolase superfamily) [Wenxinia marina DSM 24838]GGL61385.1 hydrolase [Wenxinia marina]